MCVCTLPSASARNTRPENRRNKCAFPDPCGCPGHSSREAECCSWSQVWCQSHSQSQPHWAGLEPRVKRMALIHPPSWCRRPPRLRQNKESSSVNFTIINKNWHLSAYIGMQILTFVILVVKRYICPIKRESVKRVQVLGTKFRAFSTPALPMTCS